MYSTIDVAFPSTENEKEKTRMLIGSSDFELIYLRFFFAIGVFLSCSFSFLAMKWALLMSW